MKAQVVGKSISAIISGLKAGVAQFDQACRVALEKTGKEAKDNLAILLMDHRSDREGGPIDREGNPVPHLYQLTRYKLWPCPDGSGSGVVIGAAKPARHLHLVNAGTVQRKRTRREWFGPPPFKGMGSREGGTGGIGGKYVFVEYLIQIGASDPEKRHTGEADPTHVMTDALHLSRNTFEAEMAKVAGRLFG